MIKAVLFDLDGLMADSEPLARWAWDQTLAAYGHRLDDQAYHAILGLRLSDSARVLCERFALPVSPAQAAQQRDRLFLEAVPTHLRARPGLYHLLDALTERSLPLGVATSGHRRYVSLALRTLGIADRFAAVVTGDDVSRGKPAPDVYLMAAERLGVKPTRCIALEDTPLGLAAARAAGMFCVAVPNADTSGADFSAAHRCFPSLDAVAATLDELLSQTGGLKES